jgi:hypothetical protein
MDERPIDGDPQAAAGGPERAAPATPRPASPTPELLLPPSTGKEAWRSGSGCGPRMRIYLLLVAAVILLALLFAGLSVLRRGVWVTLEQGRRTVVQNLPLELPPAERQRTAANLERFRRLLERLDDPYPVMGEFMRRVRAAMADSRLTVGEVEELNLFLERVIEESGIPPLQLGIRNSEFGIRNAALPPLISDSAALRRELSEISVHGPAPGLGRRSNDGGVAGNSEFRIPNSEFV